MASSDETLATPTALQTEKSIVEAVALWEAQSQRFRCNRGRIQERSDKTQKNT